MKTLEIYNTRKDELVELTLNLLPTALSGDRANRTFFFKENEDGSLTVDYHYYSGQIVTSDNCFYTIKDHQTPDPSEFGYENFEEMDFDACGFSEQIENAIDEKIALIEE